MRLWVRMVVPFGVTGGARMFECRAVRVLRADDDPECDAVVLVDVDLPPQYRCYAAARYWNEDGTYRVEAPTRRNRRSLAAFIASGDQVWHIGDI